MNRKFEKQIPQKNPPEMGVRGFFSYVKKRIPNIDPKEQDSARIGIDIHGLFYLWQDDLDSLKNMIHNFKEANHECIIVFDGEAPEQKKEQLMQRKQKRDEYKQQISGIQSFLESPESRTMDKRSREYLEKHIESLQVLSWQITSEYRRKVMTYLDTLQIPYILAKGEADDVLLDLARQKKIDIILTSDMDFIRFGVNRIWIPNFKANSFQVYDFDIPIFCDEEDINIETLADIAKLCETTYPSEAFGLMRYYGSLQNLANRLPKYKSLIHERPELSSPQPL